MAHKVVVIQNPHEGKDLLTLIAEAFNKRHFGTMSIANANLTVQMLSDGALNDREMTKYMLSEIGKALIEVSNKL